LLPVRAPMKRHETEMVLLRQSVRDESGLGSNFPLFGVRLAKCRSREPSHCPQGLRADKRVEADQGPPLPLQTSAIVGVASGRGIHRGANGHPDTGQDPPPLARGKAWSQQSVINFSGDGKAVEDRRR